jgi:Predicted acetyltransferase
MDNIAIRPAAIEDALRIHEINKSSLGYDFPPDKTRDRIHLVLPRSNHRIYVACLDGRVVGYIHGSEYECTYCDSLKDILALAVDPDYQGRGIGRMLLCALEDWARLEGCTGIRLVSGFNRQEAHRFYLHCGYTDRRDLKNFIKFL